MLLILHVIKRNQNLGTAPLPRLPRLLPKSDLTGLQTRRFWIEGQAEREMHFTHLPDQLLQAKVGRARRAGPQIAGVPRMAVGE